MLTVFNYIYKWTTVLAWSTLQFHCIIKENLSFILFKVENETCS